MTSRRLFFLVLSLNLIVSTCFGISKESEAASLIERAKQLSEIRAEGAPGFRLKITFKTVKKDGSVAEGTYTEVWASKAQWRKDIVLGDFRRTEIVVGRKRWLLDSSMSLPTVTSRITDLSSLTEMSRLRPETRPEMWKPDKIADRETKSITVRCLESKFDTLGGRSALCFDKSSGVLVAEITPLELGKRIVDKACYFSDYQNFGNRTLARFYECDEDRDPRLSARIVELVAEPTPDPSLFRPLDGAKESVNCLVVKPPTPVHQEKPNPPKGMRGRNVVVMTMRVGTDGKPHDLMVSSAPNGDFDEAALKAARQWRFKPATCDGEAVEVEITLETDFHY
jgi:TonB family protein